MKASGILKTSNGIHSRNAIVCGILVVALAALWPLLRPYDWLNRDAQIYALQAIAHVYPERYKNDLFFLFGSQDRFTLLTAVVAPLFGSLGVERASAWLTVGANLIWWSSCYLLARGLLGPRLAWVSLVTVMVAPGWYGGGGGVFRYAETYFSARLPAEAMVLFALALQLRGRSIAAGIALALSSLVHPLMTAPGLAMFALLATPRRWWPALVAGAIASLAVAVVIALFAPWGRLRVVDPAWLQVITTRSSFLFPMRWFAGDWTGVATTFLLLLTAVTVHDSPPIRRIALGAIVVGSCGMFAATVGSDLVPIEIILQGQVWRAMWLVTVIAVLLVPSTILNAWRMDGLGRAAAVLLLTTLCALDQSAGLIAAAAGTSCVLLTRRVRSDPVPRVVFAATVLAFAVTLAANLLGVVDVLNVPVFGGAGDARLEPARNIAAFGVPALAFATAVWYATILRARTSSIFFAACIVTALTLFTWRPALAELATGTYFGDRYRAFASWRDRIPPGTNVFWPTAPVTVWYLLERPSYISISQLAGVVFSRDLALEATARAQKLKDYVDPDWVMGDPTHSDNALKPLTSITLRGICAIPEIGFVVSATRLPEAVATEAWPDSSHYIHLYDCTAIRPQS